MKVYTNCPETILHWTSEDHCVHSSARLPGSSLYPTTHDFSNVSVTCFFYAFTNTSTSILQQSYGDKYYKYQQKAVQKINTCNHNKKCWTEITVDEDDDGQSLVPVHSVQLWTVAQQMLAWILSLHFFQSLLANSHKFYAWLLPLPEIKICSFLDHNIAPN